VIVHDLNPWYESEQKDPVGLLPVSGHNGINIRRERDKKTAIAITLFISQ